MNKTVVLITDDEKKIRDMYREILELEGFEVIEAYDAKEAVIMLRNKKPELVLLDINMPGGPFHVIDTIKAEGMPSKVMIVSVKLVDEQKLLMPQADGYHDKSAGTDELIRKIKGLFSK
ncbi:MAG: response regulator transcription factor [Elusimicrobiota bacterium]